MTRSRVCGLVSLRGETQRYQEGFIEQILSAPRSLAINPLQLDGVWSITEGIATVAHIINGVSKLLGMREAAEE